MHELILWAERHAPYLWLGLVGVAAFVADWATGHI